MSVNALFLNLNDFSRPQRLVLLTSLLTAVRISTVNFWPQFSGSCETEELLRSDWLLRASSSFCTVMGCCSSRTRPQGSQSSLDANVLLLGQKVDPGALTEDDWGVGQLMRRRAFLRGDWRATGRDSLPGARSVGGQGGAIGVRWSKCPGLRHPPEPSPSRRLERQVRPSWAAEGLAPGDWSWGLGTAEGLEGGAGWMRPGAPGLRESGPGPGRLVGGWGLLPAEPLRNLFFSSSPRYCARRVPRLLTRTSSTSSRFSWAEGRCPAPRPEMGLREGRWGRLGPGSPGLARGCSAQSPGDGGIGRRGGKGGEWAVKWGLATSRRWKQLPG